MLTPQSLHWKLLLMDRWASTSSLWSLRAQMTGAWSVDPGHDLDPEQVMRCGSHPSPAQGTLCSNMAAPCSAPGKCSLHFCGTCRALCCPKGPSEETFPGPAWTAAVGRASGRAARPSRINRVCKTRISSVVMCHIRVMALASGLLDLCLGTLT